MLQLDPDGCERRVLLLGGEGHPRAGLADRPLGDANAPAAVADSEVADPAAGNQRIGERHAHTEFLGRLFHGQHGGTPLPPHWSLGLSRSKELPRSLPMTSRTSISTTTSSPRK